MALVASGCSSGGDEATDVVPSATSNEPVTLSVATFNEFGYEDLYKEYMELNPNVTITLADGTSTTRPINEFNVMPR